MTSLQGPPAAPIDLTSQAFKQHPFPTLARLRQLGPVARVRIPVFGTVWMATTHDAVNDLLRDHHRFARDPIAAGNRWMGALFRWLPRTLRPLTRNMLVLDPPDHRRLRGLVDQAFGRHSVEALHPRLEALADEALERLAALAARSPVGVDLLAHFARPFPLAVITEMLGLPPEDRPKFTRWASNFTTATSVPGLLWALLTGVRQMVRYCRAEFHRQTRHPRGGLLAALIEAEEAGDRLSEDELVAMVFLLLAAGHETTMHQIAGSVLTLLDHPQQLAALTADWGLADSAAQELLRHVSFAQVSKPRYPREDTEFHGQPVRRGQMIFACLASANSDPSVFDQPDRLDIHRQPNRHVAFGAGVHVCLGAKLARDETAVALRRLFTRFPDLRLAVPRNRVRFSTRLGTRALVALPVRLLTSLGQNHSTLGEINMTADPHRPLREHLLYLLQGGGAHLHFDKAVDGVPPALRGATVAPVPHSPWRLLEHMRIAQWDILEFSRNPMHVSPPWPDGYWPRGDAPPDDRAWDRSVEMFRADLEAMCALVADPATDLFAPIAHGDGQTILREALLIADHNAYHLGQLVVVRRLLGCWPDEG